MAEEVKNPASSPVEEGSSKTDKQKKKKEKKRKHRDLEDAFASNVEEKVDIPSSKKDKKQKKKEKPKVEAKEEESDDGSNSEDMKLDTEDTLLGDDDKDVRRKARKEERMERKREKEELLKKVPKVDQDGIAYTKLQIKRMLKRVKQGLSPVPTAEEERQKLRNEAQLRREEEAELAGMIFRREDDGDDNDEGDDDKPTGEDENDALDDDDSEQDEDDLPTGSGSNHDDQEKFSKEVQQPPKKKSKRSKLVPSDYVCQACKNKHSPAHWIYDCPAKVTVKGTNNKKKKERGLNQPDSRKVFVSGLPFEVKPADVQQLFQGCGKVASCKLVKFGDTGRCNGQAYVTFESDEAATKSLKLSGTMIDNTKEESSKKKSKKSDASPSKRSELKLKISRVLNRRQTKKN